MSNLPTIYTIYEAFGKGDVDTILSHCTDDVVWEYGHNSTDAPWLQRGEGKEGARATMYGTAAIETTHFMPTAFIEGDGVVVVLFNTEFTVRETGKQVAEEDAVHIWRFNDAGQVVRFRHRIDTLQQQLAFNG